ncbi:DNA replication and repair protein RecF [Cohaesibacter sp. ES.047]|uniref:DNA replication/repair protein RecF n=1 Tax=Cohaesibacter sp. ES.047 TaxID=1798205 RepID=UPI000BC0CEDE|nr:DNA replication/repair protein RecF [Cohaesibacter sp. ES.047]SNY90365.1 DNA replication and repair protein RecF [Cohaesibacter sp. ES.047]
MGISSEMPFLTQSRTRQATDRDWFARMTDTPSAAAFLTQDDAPVDRVSVRSVSLTDYRNYPTLSLALTGRHVVLTGANGSGKTNLLEAISFLSPGRGLRRVAYPDIAREGASGSWAVSVAIDTPFGPTKLGTGLQPSPDGSMQRRIRINGAPSKSAEGLGDHVSVIWLTPQMDSHFTGAASERRKWLDRMVLAIDKTHGSRVNAFEKAMRQRNRLLEEAPHETVWLDGIEAQMAEYGSAIATARAELVSLLNRSLDLLHANEGSSAFPNALVGLEGILEAEAFSRPAIESEEHYRGILAQMRNRDRGAGRTLEGPHRSDLIVRHGPKDMPAAKCSTGEQKALLLGIVLAHAHLVAERCGRTPLVLLDEVAAHLDESRRLALFDLLDRLGCQAWVTGTDDAVFEPLGDRAERFHVDLGTVVPITRMEHPGAIG